MSEADELWEDLEAQERRMLRADEIIADLRSKLAASEARAEKAEARASKIAGPAERYLEANPPFTSRFIGAPGSEARLLQERQMTAAADLRAALKE